MKTRERKIADLRHLSPEEKRVFRLAKKRYLRRCMMADPERAAKHRAYHRAYDTKQRKVAKQRAILKANKNLSRAT